MVQGYCPHFHEVMDLNDCYFCYFKKIVKLTVFLGFRNGRLITVVESTFENVESAFHVVDYFITNPRDADKQIAEWKDSR